MSQGRKSPVATVLFESSPKTSNNLLTTERRKDIEALFNPNENSHAISASELTAFRINRNEPLLHTITRDGTFENLEFLLNHHFIANAQNTSNNQTALHQLTNQSDADVRAKRLLQSNDNSIDVNQQDSNGMSALHYAVAASGQKNHTYINTLLSHGADVNLHNHDRQSPLHIAAINNDLETIKILLAQNTIDTNVPDKFGNTPLHYSIEDLSPQTMPISTEIVRRLLLAKANPNHQNYLGQTPLSRANKLGCEAIVHLLLENGARPRDAGLNAHVPWFRSLSLSSLENQNIREDLTQHSYPSYWFAHAAAASIISLVYVAVATSSFITGLHWGLAVGLVVGVISKYFHEKKYQKYCEMRDKIRHEEAHIPADDTVAEVIQLGATSATSNSARVKAWFALRSYTDYSTYGAGEVASTVGDQTFLNHYYIQPTEQTPREDTVPSDATPTLS